jgi:hypothetical protein
MISSFFINNFKEFSKAEMPLVPLTLLIGANASGKSNMLEAIRILVKGSRLDDLEKSLLSADSLVRGKSEDLFKLPGQSLGVGCQVSGIAEGWERISSPAFVRRENPSASAADRPSKTAQFRERNLRLIHSVLSPHPFLVDGQQLFYPTIPLSLNVIKNRHQKERGVADNYR